MVDRPDEGRGRVETNYPGAKTGEGPDIQKDYSGPALAEWGMSADECRSSIQRDRMHEGTVHEICGHFVYSATR